MIRLKRLALLVACLPACLAQGPPPSTGELGSRIWIGRYQEIEDYLRTAECVSVEVFGTYGAARCTMRPGGPVARMAWRPFPPGLHRGFWQSFKSEIAAYELDKLLKMDMVPPTVERQLQGVSGAAQLWVEKVVDAADPATPDEKHRAHWESQLVRMAMFDYLVGNGQRNQRNMLRDGAWNLILVDHTRAFAKDAEPPQLKRIDASAWAKIEGLTRNQLDKALRAWLESDQIEAILDRRDRMRAEIKLLPR